MDPKAFLLQKFNVTARQQIANLLDCTSWSGAGPGLMNAVTQDLRWREVKKAIPLKKRRGEFDNNMEENISDSNRKKTNKIQSRSSRTKTTKMNMAWEQDEDAIIKDEEKEAEEEVVAVDEEEGLIHV
ncbi:uncharacterized protein LOC107629589 [Arachis ipaensis]|uniref:uncharacterized protein LOC107629589 n=1 Tax=Arachis ipaensis TaxID=130454 RepID=UPI0007AFA4E4|nr:uncharacterized protein LOC107629589 [Arachis ipaensis]XP_016187893.1 uncharacterized protein LOC107629589 [Arachis ipaensis]XP_020973775.1 uncharacterized protein LOC107629589 [Arachis ipaensis]XP_020973776.1 uncharacterized protein LOC107629589 [Arachis ipaensis]XP_025642701.1 uncharacterized protein LOC112737145 [Arachis hypogaea]QHN99515.1 uncharacterized protein DS421_13g398490 [Arachis hypogaea]